MTDTPIRVSLDDFNSIPAEYDILTPDPTQENGQAAAKKHAGEPAPASEWLIDAAELLSQPDPGPTPWLVENLIVDQAIVAAVGRWKTTKSYGILDLCISIATGRPAFGHLPVPNAGPVIFINEESGIRALWRRLDALCRGRAIYPEELRGQLHIGANARVKLDDLGWQKHLKDMGHDLEPKLICFDPLARMKDPGREENAQSGMAFPIEFMRELRNHCNAAVLFVHHTGHQGDNMRGSSDLESVWESRLAWKRDGQSPEVTIESEHREAEAAGPITYEIRWDTLTRTMRFEFIPDSVIERVAQHLKEHPDDSANKVFDALGGNRKEVLEAVKTLRQPGGTNAEYHLGTTPPEAPPEAGTRNPPFRGVPVPAEEPGTKLPVPPLDPTGLLAHLEQLYDPDQDPAAQ